MHPSTPVFAIQLTMPTSSSPLESMVAKAESLYTLPAVAMEVLRLTDSERVDTRALKECIERDPALAAKLLKVVNSSMFGLSGKVENLTQALALLGIKPLKLLVLGFSLPEGLLDDLDAEQLQRYWRGALTRAVAARQLAETQWKTAGDDAFLVGLLQDIGMLVLLQQLGTPYARFLEQVRNERARLVDLEQSSLGFNHRALTVALMQKWKLPEMYWSPIVDEPPQQSTRRTPNDSTITQVLDLANLLSELVDEHRLTVLPELLERGRIYCALTKDDLDRLVAEVEPQVEQLAQVLQIDLGEGQTYQGVLAAAHLRLSQVAEDAAGMLLLTDDQICDNLLAETEELQQAMQSFTQPTPAAPAAETDARAHGAQPTTPAPRGRTITAEAAEATAAVRLASAVAAAAAACRQRRESLSLLVFEADSEDSSLDTDTGSALQSAIQTVVIDHHLAGEQVLPLTPTSGALLLPTIERREAAEIAQQMSSALAAAAGNSYLALPVHLKAGIATICAIPNAFESGRLLDAAQNCLSAARTSGGSSTKSIEVY